MVDEVDVDGTPFDQDAPRKTSDDYVAEIRARQNRISATSHKEQPLVAEFQRDGGIGMYPPPSPGATDLAEPGMFASNDGLVINWCGENFYKACGERVLDGGTIGGSSYCVKREGHHNDHEDYDGRIKRSDVCTLCGRAMDDHMLLTTSLAAGDLKASVPTGWLCPRGSNG